MEGEYVVSAGLECGTEETVTHLGEASAYYYHLGVQDVYDGGEAYTRKIGGSVEDSGCDGVAGLSRLEDDLGVDRGRVAAAQCRLAALIDLAENLLTDCGP